MRTRMLFAEALRSLRASASTTLAATMTVLIGMFLLGLFIALGSWVVSWSDHVKKEVIVKVFFCTQMSCGYEASSAQINAVAAKLHADPQVKNFTFVSQEEALKRTVLVGHERSQRRAVVVRSHRREAPAAERRDASPPRREPPPR